MPFTLTVDLPNLGSQEIYIHGLGSFSNGTHTISDEQAEQFRVINSKTGFGPADKDGVMPLVDMPGISLEEAVSNMYGVTIEVDTGPKSENKAPRELPAGRETQTTSSGTEDN